MGTAFIICRQVLAVQKRSCLIKLCCLYPTLYLQYSMCLLVCRG